MLPIFKLKLKFYTPIVLALATVAIAPSFLPTAHAQYSDTASLSRREMVGTWHSAANNRYTFRSGGTYTFTTGNRSSGNVSHSGTWKLARGGRSLRLHATRRVVLEGRKRRTLKASKNFAFVIATQDPQAGFYLAAKSFVRQTCVFSDLLKRAPKQPSAELREAMWRSLGLRLGTLASDSVRRYPAWFPVL